MELVWQEDRFTFDSEGDHAIPPPTLSSSRPHMVDVVVISSDSEAESELKIVFTPTKRPLSPSSSDEEDHGRYVHLVST